MCKHWLRGLCKKGDQCEFLHEYDMSKMPECYFYTRFSELFSAWPYLVTFFYAKINVVRNVGDMRLTHWQLCYLF